MAKNLAWLYGLSTERRLAMHVRVPPIMTWPMFWFLIRYLLNVDHDNKSWSILADNLDPIVWILGGLDGRDDVNNNKDVDKNKFGTDPNVVIKEAPVGKWVIDGAELTNINQWRVFWKFMAKYTPFIKDEKGNEEPCVACGLLKYVGLAPGLVCQELVDALVAEYMADQRLDLFKPGPSKLQALYDWIKNQPQLPGSKPLIFMPVELVEQNRQTLISVLKLIATDDFGTNTDSHNHLRALLADKALAAVGMPMGMLEFLTDKLGPCLQGRTSNVQGCRSAASNNVAVVHK